MNSLRKILILPRMILGITFIMSGFFKLTDPVGTSLIVEEYLNVLHLGFLRFGAVLFGMLLSVFELLIGISVLTCIRIRTGSWCALIMVAFFTVLTLVTAIFDLVADCGCFGQAIHLSLWQTFYKNLVLSACAVPIFLFRNKFKPVAPIVAEWVFIGIFGLLSLMLTVCSFIFLPFVEYTNFSVGSNLLMLYDNINDPSNFETRLIYEKDGRKEYFSIDSLPDSTWEYVDVENVYNGSGSDMLFDMTLSDRNGEIVTESIVNADRPIFLFVLSKPEKAKGHYWEMVGEAADSAGKYGLQYYVAVPSDQPYLDSLDVKYPSLANAWLFGDYKVLATMSRSNGGVVCIDDGVVVRKWSRRKFKPDQIGRTVMADSEEIAAMGIIWQRLFYESAILLIFLVLVLFRYVCGMVYNPKATKHPKTRLLRSSKKQRIPERDETA